MSATREFELETETRKHIDKDIKKFWNFDDIKLEVNLKKLKIINPPIELQNKFAEEVIKFEKIRTIQENSLKELEDLFNSTMQKAFSGEL